MGFNNFSLQKTRRLVFFFYLQYTISFSLIYFLLTDSWVSVGHRVILLHRLSILLVCFFLSLPYLTELPPHLTTGIDCRVSLMKLSLRRLHYERMDVLHLGCPPHFSFSSLLPVSPQERGGGLVES